MDITASLPVRETGGGERKKSWKEEVERKGEERHYSVFLKKCLQMNPPPRKGPKAGLFF